MWPHSPRSLAGRRAEGAGAKGSRFGFRFDCHAQNSGSRTSAARAERGCGEQRDFSEALVLVPNSYFISGHAYQYPLTHPVQAASETPAPRAARAAQRTAHGLPAVVVPSIAQNNTITPHPPSVAIVVI